MFDLTGKTALITGATGGIGAAIARTLHAAGATVLCAGTRIQVLDQLVSDLGERALAVAADLQDPTSGDALVRRAESDMGKLDILVNNAGFARDSLALRMKDEDWASVIEVNLTAAFRLARASLRGMVKRREGRIISISSVVGVMGNPGQANYCAAKAGLIGLTKSLAQEVASRGVTVNCVAPGFIETPMTDALTEQQQARILQNIPAARLGRSDEVAAAVLYLASAEAAYVTGQTLHLNGGLLMP
ncbi:MAG: 3-oxoacyl-[acyl-carrier-protein] reductase [Aliidongia sp.]